MDIIISWNDEAKKIKIPILPSSFEIEDSMNNTTVTIHGLGDINLKGKRGLYGLSFESFFPGQPYDFKHGSYHDPYDYYVKRIKKLFENNTTIHVVITETDINGFFTIESFTYGQAEKNHDVNYSLSFREYRIIDTKGKKTKRQNKGVKDKTVKWKKGDTWPKVTKSVLGSSESYKKQKLKNKAVINKAKKQHPDKKEKDALVGYKVVIKA